MRIPLLAFLLTVACGDPSPAPGPPGGWSRRVQVAFGASLEHRPLAPCRIEEASIWGGALHLKVSYTGGDRFHEFDLLVFSGWMESHPVQVRAVLLNDTKGDEGEERRVEDLFFDLTPLRAAYAEAYRKDSGTIIIQLADPAAPNGPVSTRVDYSF